MPCILSFNDEASSKSGYLSLKNSEALENTSKNSHVFSSRAKKQSELSLEAHRSIQIIVKSSLMSSKAVAKHFNSWLFTAFQVIFSGFSNIKAVV